MHQSQTKETLRVQIKGYHLWMLLEDLRSCEDVLECRQELLLSLLLHYHLCHMQSLHHQHHLQSKISNLCN